MSGAVRSGRPPAAPGTSGRERFRAVLQRLPTLWLLIKRDTKVRYADSVLGYLWSFLDPLLMTMVMWFVFSVIFDRSVGEDPYILFLISGMLGWNWASSAIGQSASALTKDKRLVASINLPREIWALRIVGSTAVEYVLSIPVLIIIAIFTWHAPGWYILALPLAFLVEAALLTGIVLLLAPIGVLVTDTQNVVRLVMRLLFYASPIFYGFNNVTGPLRHIYMLNPLVGIIDLNRAAWFPAAYGGWTSFAISAAWAVVLLWVGGKVFHRYERRALKEL